MTCKNMIDGLSVSDIETRNRLLKERLELRGRSAYSASQVARQRAPAEVTGHPVID